MSLTETQAYLLAQLQIAVGGLELESSHPLRQDLATLSAAGAADGFRIAVFAPFNYGKSTLLNAILGERTLPMDLIPTTGAAITVRYGAERQTRIRFTSGDSLTELGTDLLQEYAILDGERRMRADVAAVEVWCPHPWLQTGVELLDLPGTDDREAQDALVRDRLLTADLVVQVLDGRKLMTLGEREHLRDWLQDRGIETVVFVVNFLNLLEPEDQKQVAQRMRFVTESFRSQLPAGVSNLFRVDALPALRARLKGDVAAAQETGLPVLEAALQTIVVARQQQGWQPQRARILALTEKVQTALEARINQLQTEIAAEAQHRQAHQLGLKQRAQSLLQQGYRESVTNLQNWLTPNHLYQTYGRELSRALQIGDFPIWQATQLQPDWENHWQAVVGWVQKTADFFRLSQPPTPGFSFPPEPILEIPNSPPAAASNEPISDETAAVAIATGLGLIAGGPVGAAVLGGASLLLNQLVSSSMEESQSAASNPQQTPQLEQISRQAATQYLTRFSQTALRTLADYEATATPIINCPLTVEVRKKTTLQQHQLRFLTSTLAALNESLKALQVEP